LFTIYRVCNYTAVHTFVYFILYIHNVRKLTEDVPLHTWWCYLPLRVGDEIGGWRRKSRIASPKRFLRGKTFNHRPFARAPTTSLASLINVYCRYHCRCRLAPRERSADTGSGDSAMARCLETAAVMTENNVFTTACGGHGRRSRLF